ncbi:type VI secretion system protein TssA [Aliikangiella coralliicola]|uniref:Type VI secretion system protein TssA n=1 Tax=Aliikangiella coralliicola TaxID=2592383 RepID=A0A545U8T1_9GAMM|nr:type VI secretion system protein TssA [Aliikangiella coralliicola]TQV85868.1 type VI secretion system protein TssA [Aliikangiella coralliicola]
MSSPEIVDISSLVEPISEENIVGDDPRNDPSPTSLYSKIKDARNSARAAERNSMFDGDNTEANEKWKEIMSLAPQILSSVAKDLEVACWYSEALIRNAGFQGLRDGFTLIRQLIEKYWESNLYPVEDEDGIETRVAPVSGLNGEGAEGVLLAPIRSAYITDDIAPGPFSLWQYKQAIDIKRITDEDNRAAQASKAGFSMDDIEKSVEQSSSEYFVDLRDDITDCLSEYRQISELLTSHCGTHDAPSTSKIIELLEESLGAVNYIAKHKFPLEPAADSSAEESSNDEQAPTSDSSIVVGSVVNSRVEAFKQLTTISEFFRRTEPHSPISYIIDKAVRWGDMPLDQLMSELIPDSSSLGTYCSLTGVHKDDD